MTYDASTDARECYEVAIQTIREQKPLNGDGYCHCRICEKERGAAFGETCTPGTKTGRVDGQTDNARTFLREAVRGA